MTLAQQIIYAERRARVSSNATTLSTANDVTIQYINEGVREFCKIIGGLDKVGYLSLSPKFDLGTNWAIRTTYTSGANALAATDLVLAATAQSSLSGASAAAYIGSQISNTQAVSVSVSWDSTTWKFSLYDEIGSMTYVQVAAPSGIAYVNATDWIFNKTGTQSGTYFVGDIPLDLVLETALPDDCLSVKYVEWNKEPLALAPFDLFVTPQSQGDPRWYAVKGQKIRVSPTPSRQELFTIQYRYMPTDLSTTSDECPLPDQYHWAPVWYAASMLAGENHDTKVQQECLGLFLDQAYKAKIREENQNPSMFPRDPGYQVPKVEL